MIIHNYKTSEKLEHPDGKQWLKEQGYQIITFVEKDGYTFDIFTKSNTQWATYHPAISGLKSTEIVYHNIPSREQAASLVSVATQMIVPLSGLAAIQSGGQIPETMQVMIINPDSDIDAAAQRITDSMFPPDESKGTT